MAAADIAATPVAQRSDYNENIAAEQRFVI